MVDTPGHADFGGEVSLCYDFLEHRALGPLSNLKLNMETTFLVFFPFSFLNNKFLFWICFKIFKNCV